VSDAPLIRRARREDAAELARLIAPLGYALTEAEVAERWAAWVAAGDVALVVDGEDSLLGVITLHTMVVLHRPRAVGRITSLVVDPEARGRGLGRALVSAAEKTLTEAGCGLVEVTSHARRMAAHDFYRHLGYEQTSWRFAKTLAPT
jgi:GNAT superfamily N-acetyltransferase